MGKSTYKGAVKAKAALKKFFGLEEEATVFCEYVYLKQSFNKIDNYFEDHLELNMVRNQKLLATLLNIPFSQINRYIRQVAEMRLLNDYEWNTSMRLNNSIVQLWSQIKEENIQNLFFSTVKGDVIPLEEFQLDSTKVKQVLALLSCKTDFPVNILLYGPPGCGKTTFAYSVAHHLGKVLYGVSNQENDKDLERRSFLIACAHMVDGRDDAIALVDEAECLLDTSAFFAQRNHDKAWINTFLEQSGRKMIWITNHIDHIELSVLRRFSFSIGFEQLNQGQRVKTFSRILRQYKKNRTLS
ncbi:MAG: AAA family ATPase, partial [Desulfovibrio sp.]|nr:AAA family ATPase [Desulfovibrio sp.]